MEPSITWITHKGKEILFNDRHNFGTEEIIKSVRSALEIVKRSGKKDILYLVDSSHNFIVPEVKNVIKETGKEMNPYLKKSAVIGISGAQKVLINVLNKLTKFSIKVFNNIDEAKDWLVQ